MNKFIAIALLAFACQMVVAHVEEIESQSVIIPDNDEEVQYLTDKTKGFSEFCIESRNFVTKDIKDNANDAASRAYNILFNTVQSIFQNALNVNQDATEQLANQIRNPDAPIVDGANAAINEGMLRIHAAEVQPKSLYEAVKANLIATGASVSQQVAQKVESLKNISAAALVPGALVSACEKVAKYNEQLKKNFEDAKAGLVKEGADVADVTFSQVNCVTSKRVNTIEGICNFVNVAKAPVWQAIGRA